MRLAMFLLLSVLCVGCSGPTSSVPKGQSQPYQPYTSSTPSSPQRPNESVNDRLKREHIYEYIQRQRVREMWYSGATEKVDLEGDCRRQYDGMPVQELYDLARFKFGYKEPK